MTAKTLKIIDSKQVNIGISEARREKIAKALAGFLASSYTLYQKTQYYHWNVTGPQFNSLHTLFEAQYTELAMAVDELAERIRALGHFTPGTPKEFAKLSTIQEDAALPSSAKQMVENLLNDHQTCSNAAREALKLAQDAGDEVTTDILIGRMTTHDKTAWMLRATLE